MKPVEIGALKREVTEIFPPGHPLRELILAQPDRLDPTELSVKAGDWLQLLSVLERQPSFPRRTA